MAIVGAVAGLVLAVHAVTWVPAGARLASSVGIPALSSLAALSAAVSMLAVSRIRSRRRRTILAIAVLGGFLAATVGFPLELQRSGSSYMGDGLDFAFDRGKFIANVPAAGGHPAIHFKSHLGDALLASVDWVFGRTDEAPQTAYKVVSRLGGILFLFELGIVVWVWRAAPRVCRFAAVALALPLALGFFGYYELGYLAVGAAVFPLVVLSGKSRFSDQALSGAGALQGLHAALHGFGVLGLMGGTFAVLAARASWPQRAWRMARFAAFGTAAYLGWIAIYAVLMKWTIESDPATANVVIRAVTDTFVADRRIVHPLASASAFIEIGAAGLAVGVPMLAASMALSQAGSDRIRALCYAAPGLLFLILWWPTQGVSQDLDLLVGAFPGAIAGAWTLARSVRTAMIGVALAAFAHVAFWSAVITPELDRVWIE